MTHRDLARRGPDFLVGDLSRDISSNYPSIQGQPGDRWGEAISAIRDLRPDFSEASFAVTSRSWALVAIGVVAISALTFWLAVGAP